MSWNLARGEEFLSNVSLAELKKQIATEKKRQPRLRLLIALNRKKGKSIDQIADMIGLHRRAVHDILHRFEERGLDAAQAKPKPGRTPHLTKKQLQDLRKRLLRTPQQNDFDAGFWNSRLVQKLVHQQYHVQYCKSNLPKLLSKLGFSYKKPKPTNPRMASDEEVAAFKKKRVVPYWLPNAKKEHGL